MCTERDLEGERWPICLLPHLLVFPSCALSLAVSLSLSRFCLLLVFSTNVRQKAEPSRDGDSLLYRRCALLVSHLCFCADLSAPFLFANLMLYSYKHILPICTYTHTYAHETHTTYTHAVVILTSVKDAAASLFLHRCVLFGFCLCASSPSFWTSLSLFVGSCFDFTARKSLMSMVSCSRPCESGSLSLYLAYARLIIVLWIFPVFLPLPVASFRCACARWSYDPLLFARWWLCLISMPGV